MKTNFQYFSNIPGNIFRKTFNAIVCIAFLGLFSCASDDGVTPVNELAGLAKIQDVVAGPHTIELYSASGTLQQGYNAISMRIKDNDTGAYITNAQFNWIPVMHMMSMTHSCPASVPVRTPDTETLYNGFIIFQMAQNDVEYWTIQIDYTIEGTAYSVNSNLEVPASDNQRVTSFMGGDGTRYIVALVGPTNPEVAVNEMTVAVYKMQSMMSFVPVEGYSIQIDPRMPGMGNHGSPNNTDLVYLPADGLYHGNLSLTMTGYWCINMVLRNSGGTVIKGEAVTEENPQSSLYLDLAF